MACRSLKSRRRRPWSSAILKMMVSTSVWISLRSRIRARRSGPISGYGGPDRKAGLPVGIPERNGISLWLEARKPDLGGPLDNFLVIPAGFSEAGEVALDIGKKDRDPDGAEILCKNA
jgi:hypothetical protein